ncbi:MAG TPA: PQQ-binding-like beta-propeller repeat protein [Planctomycetaceae bacterium]|nr:PQQ-binding-like beta-propeller repeat protein [Planctomycetaceae bacterium]
MPAESCEKTEESQAATAFLVAQSAAPPREPRLRLWPGVLIVALYWLANVAAGLFVPGTMTQFNVMFLGPMVAGAAIIGWWLFASRIRWRDRWRDVLVCCATGAAAVLLYDSSLGAFGLILYAIPAVVTGWVVWMIIGQFLTPPVRRAGLAAVFVLGFGYYALVRLEGVDGSMSAALAYRWTNTPEEKFLAGAASKQNLSGNVAGAAPADPIMLAPGDWPGFRGPDRDGRLPGIRLATDWETRPPRQAWRHRVGPGWSSFALAGGRLFTQEQHDQEEAVVCYSAESGAELWVHRDQARFTEIVAGPGPRATPTFHDGKIYSLGAKGELNCLDAGSGRTVWSRNIASDSGAEVPQWGFAASPLVAQDVVTVYAGAAKGKSVLAYSAATGEPVWSAGEGQKSYCSTQLSRLCEVDQLLIATDAGLAAFDPALGNVLWRYDWPFPAGARVVQPAVVGDSDVLIGTPFGVGTQRIHVGREAGGWTVAEVWQEPSRAIRPYYNDLVVHGGHLYGFDSNFLTCVSLETGKSAWRTRGYGNGQVLLLSDQDLLLVVSEKGEVALVDANPQRHIERCRFQAIEGKTWNHPVVAHGALYVRNGEEAACYLLNPAGEEPAVGEANTEL